LGIRDESMFKAASGLHGGIGGKEDVCGALLGASMMLGFMVGKSPAEMNQSGTAHQPGEPNDATKLVGELYDWFKNEFGSVKCQAIKERYQGEVNAEPDSAGLTDMEKMMRAFKKCDQLAGETAAKAAEMICDEMAKGEKSRGEKGW
jgi:C_GCAxxG_C_C family probable redox protein